MKPMAAGMLGILLVGTLGLKADNNAPSTASSDDPLAGLNLNDSSTSAKPSFADRITRHLVVRNGDQVKPLDPSNLQGVKYWAFYYSASWCVYCKVFTPKLVAFYKTFKPQHPNFEVIFVNDDQTEDAMTAYMKADEMAWPAVRFDYIADSGANKYAGSGIPDLVLVDENGKVLADSYDGSTYTGPDQVMKKIPQIVH